VSQVLQNSVIGRQIEKIVSSRPFTGSERMIRFLRFIVEQTPAGRASGINENTIGIAAFDRLASFDFGGDALVRELANSIRIELAKRSYVPLIQEQSRW
jgi:hypothetical protein